MSILVPAGFRVPGSVAAVRGAAGSGSGSADFGAVRWVPVPVPVPPGPGLRFRFRFRGSAEPAHGVDYDYTEMYLAHLYETPDNVVVV